MKCVLCNARSIVNKVDCLNLLEQSFCVDMILLTETWLDSSIPDSLLISQSNFRCFRKDRDRSGGGVCILVKPNVIVIPVTIPNKYCTLEMLALDVVGCDVKYRIIVVYRPPYSDGHAQSIMTDILSCLQELTAVSYPTIIAGDFNLPNIDWSNISGPNDMFCSPFIDFVNDAGLTQFVTSPTRGDHVLDILLSNDTYIVSDCWVESPLGFNSIHSKSSDHNTVHFNIHCDAASFTDDCDDFVYRDFANADFLALNNYLLSVDWQLMLVNSNDVDVYWNNFMCIMNTAIDMFVPLKHTKSIPSKWRHRYPYFIRQMFRKRHAAWKAHRRFKSTKLYEKYVKLDTKYKQAVHNFEVNKEQQLIDNGNIGQFYRYVNNKIVAKTGIGVIKSDKGEMLYNDAEKSECFNKFFSSVFTRDNGILPGVTEKAKPNSLTDVEFAYEDILKVIHKLKSKNTMGPDGLSSGFLKKVASGISFPLMLIFSQSFQCGKIPDSWKTAIVTPVFKKGLSCDVNNYRPISLTCVCCKIMESIIKQKMLDYLLHNKLISKHQHGFLSNHSTCTQLLECVNDWSLAIHNSYSVDVAYIDFSKAFDSVCHTKLITKLESVGIGGKLLSWINDYLSNRTQRVKVGNCFSSVSNVCSGVPQGSVLGPVLFLIYINDLIDVFGDFLSVKLFADDVKVYAVLNSDVKVHLLQEGLNKLKSWSEAWQLDLSIHKCTMLHIGSDVKMLTNNCHAYTLGGVQLPDTFETTDLGIIIDSQLRFDKHITSMVRKAHIRAALIKRCFKTRDHNLLFKAFVVFVRPLLEYCSSVWNPRYHCDVDKIESVQRRFTKYIGSLSNLSYPERLDVLHTESLELRRLKFDLTMMFRIIHQQNSVR